MKKKRESKSLSKRIAKGFVDANNPRFGFKNLVQVIVGATILAIPVAFTEETWRLGESLPGINVFGLFVLSVAFISLFAYRNYKKRGIPFYWDDVLVRVFSTYVFSFLVVAIVMTLIQRTPWEVDLILSVKRVVIVTFPACMSAAIADAIK